MVATRLGLLQKALYVLSQPAIKQDNTPTPWRVMCMWASLGTISIGYTIVVGQTPTIWYTIRGSNLSLLLTMPIGGRMAGRC